jgi:hypothetical protein
MNENYLQFIWKNKRLPFHLFRTTAGIPIQILQVGMHNTASGPDFFNGQIIIEGIKLCGNIEIHVKSSDWYVHGHQHDAAYNNVILHVVYEFDAEVLSQGVPIPTVELKEFIDWEHFKTLVFSINQELTVPCNPSITKIPQVIWWNQLSLALVERIQRKTRVFDSYFTEASGHLETVFMHFLVQSFGMKTNALPFRETINRLPINIFLKSTLFQKEALMFGCSGFLEEAPVDDYSTALYNEWKMLKLQFTLQSCNPHTWQFKGCRPQGFPAIRIAQFVTFLHYFENTMQFCELDAKDAYIRFISVSQISPSDYWDDHYHFGLKKTQRRSARISRTSAELVLINGVVPFLFWLAEKTQNEAYQWTAMELLDQIPAEKNWIITTWKKWGIHPKSAADSQGLIEMNNEWCAKKRCLNCLIGQRILDQKV